MHARRVKVQIYGGDRIRQPFTLSEHADNGNERVGAYL
jgi:hypothetical protein